MKVFKRAAVLAAAAMMGLAGCTPGGGVAAEGKDFVVRESDVQQLVNSCAGTDAATQDWKRTDYLFALMVKQAGPAIGEAAGAPLPTAQLESQMRASDPQYGTYLDGECGDILRAQMYYYFFSQRLAPQQMLEAWDTQQVRLNPRYGRWDPMAGGPDGSSGSLSIPMR